MSDRREKLIDAAYYEMKARMNPKRNDLPTVGPKVAFRQAVDRMLTEYCGKTAVLPSPEELEKMVGAGKSVREIAKEFGVTRQAVYLRLKRDKIREKNRGLPKSRRVQVV